MRDDGRMTIDGTVKALQARLTGAGGPFELVQLPDGARRFRAGANTLVEVYLRARRMADKPLLVVGSARYSYAALFEPALALAGTLRERGLAGRRIALLLDDGLDWLTWFVAITAAGAACVLPPPDAPAALVAACLESAECRLVVAATGRTLPPASENLHSIAAGGPAVNDCAVDPDSEALVVFTSGSSGIPKGVRHSHRSLLSGLRNMMLGGALSGCTRPKVGLAQSKPEPPCALVLAPLAYIAGYSAFLMSISGGGRIVLARGEPEDRIIELLELEGAQSITGASPELLRRWVRRPDAATRLRALRRLQLHGESLRRTLVEEIQTLLPEVQLLTGYGLTETSGSIATSAVSWVLDTPGCCGPLLPSVDLRIVDADDRPAAPGEMGNVQVRGDMLMRGYLDLAVSAQAFTRDGWFRTGDIGGIDRLGWINIVDRGNRKLSDALGDEGYCASIEDAVRELPGVDDAVIAVSADARDLIVFVQTKSGAAVDAGTVGALLADRAHWTGAVHVRTLDSLPRLASGKVARSALVAEAG